MATRQVKTSQELANLDRLRIRLCVAMCRQGRQGGKTADWLQGPEEIWTQKAWLPSSDDNEVVDETSKIWFQRNQNKNPMLLLRLCIGCYH